MRRLVVTLVAVASTSSTLGKVARLAEYLAWLSDDDLRTACTLLSGRPFPPGDPRRLNVGGATLADVILEVSGRPPDEMSRAYLAYGDAGDVARELLQTRRHAVLFAERLTLDRIRRDFERIADATGKGSRAAKVAVLRSLLRDADPEEARFLVRIITGDLRIGLREGLLEDAIARAFGAPLEDVRRANMLHGDVGGVAVLARGGRLGEARLSLFHPFRFMLAEVIFSAGEAFAPGRDDGAGPPAALLAEDKYDGVRAQVHAAWERVAIYSRTMDDVSYAYPDLLPDLGRLGGPCILDGEIVAWRGGRALPFVRLQQRLRRRDPGALVEEIPVAFVAFDLVHRDGDDLLDRPLVERRARLERLPLGGRAMLSRATLVHTPEELAQRFAEARDRVNEGLVVKRLDGRYQVGRRGRLWVKWKEELDTLDVVVVAAEHGHGKRAGVLSDYTFAVRDGEGLATIGKAYSGLTDAEIADLTAWFRQHTLEDRGWEKIVEPRVVLEVAFDQIHRSHRHASGYALRFPRIKAIRRDKSPDEISTLDDVRAIVARLEAGQLRRAREAGDG